MKKLIAILLTSLFLAACGGEEVAESNQENTDKTVETSTEKNEPTQEELNEKMKAEAVAADFVAANGGEYEVGTRLKATGEVSFLDDMTFTLTTEEGDGYGMYSVTYANTTDAEFNDGDTVTVYGAYDDKDETGMPGISVTVIEPVE